MTGAPAREFNPEALGNVSPHYTWQIDQSKVKITGEEVMQKLADTRPGQGRRAWAPDRAACADAIRTEAAGSPPPQRRNRRNADPNTFGFSTWLLKPGEDKVIADRLVEIFHEAQNA